MNKSVHEDAETPTKPGFPMEARMLLPDSPSPRRELENSSPGNPITQKKGARTLTFEDVLKKQPRPDQSPDRPCGTPEPPARSKIQPNHLQETLSTKEIVFKNNSKEGKTLQGAEEPISA